MNELLDRYTKIPKRIRLTMASILYVVVIVVYYTAIHGPETRKGEELQAELTKLQTLRAEKAAYVENLPQYEARLAELQESLRLARAMLPDDAAVPEFLAQLGNKARESGLNIENFEPKSEKPEDFFSEIVFNMRVLGSFHEIATFIDSVGKLDRIVNVSEISMVTPALDSKKIVVKSEFNIKTYRFISDEQRKAMEPPAKGKGK